ncbi:MULTISPECIES: hypothetical protein [Bacillus]|uniref:hypothetical protein n=1 Tax=Bacillus TaxID=1386 RepID=UPI000BFD48C8|nr:MULTISPECIES: hypothetical protein [Bacillus]PGZ69601.1 hypothetical protein COE49_21395 [Bacillus sp. AFS029637]
MDTVISNEILQQFKDRMRLGDDEDENLRRILFASNQALIKDCGAYEINEDETFKELVFERSRYVYNDALEYFAENFLTDINNFGIAKALEEIKLDGD